MITLHRLFFPVLFTLNRFGFSPEFPPQSAKYGSRVTASGSLPCLSRHSFSEGGCSLPVSPELMRRRMAKIISVNPPKAEATEDRDAI